MAKERTGGPGAETVRFPKEKICGMERFSGRRDLLGALLEDGKQYSLEEAAAAVRTFLKGD